MGAYSRTLRIVCAIAHCSLAGCEHAFEPFVENEKAGFSVFGFLDLHADTQWIRVTPVRLNTFLGTDPIDAVVTLEHVASGRIVTLSDSLRAYKEQHFGDELGAVGHARNFWTTEKLEPLAEYRLQVARSDGFKTTALVTMPKPLDFTFRTGTGRFGSVDIRAEKLLFVEVLHFDVSGVLRFRDRRELAFSAFGTHVFGVDAYPKPDAISSRRQELQVSSAHASWPYSSEITDLGASLPGRVKTNVTNGHGFVGGVAVRTIPYHSCEILVAKPNSATSCEHTYNDASAAIYGRVVRQQQCGFPWNQVGVSLTERFADGSAFIRRQVTGPRGEYRFEGIQPGIAPILDVELFNGQHLPPLQLPTLATAQRLPVPDVVLGSGC